MLDVFCVAHVAVLAALVVLFIMCVVRKNSPAKSAFMMFCLTLAIMVVGMLLEMLESHTTREAIMAVKMQYTALFPFSLSMLGFCSIMGRFKVSKAVWVAISLVECASYLALITTGTTPENNHGLFYSSMEIVHDGNFSYLHVEKGPFWTVTYVALTLLVVYIMASLIVSCVRDSTPIQRRRIGYVITGIGILFLECVLKCLGVFGGYNLFAFAALLMVVFFFLSLIRYGYFNTTASAPANALEHGVEGVVMLDERGMLIYINATAKAIIPEITKMKKAGEHTLIQSVLTDGDKTVNIGGIVYDVRSERVDDYSSPGGSIIWFVNMTKYQEQLDKINAANRAKSEFLARMSHEIRTPINTILGLNDVIRSETQSSEIRAYSENIADAGSTLLALINDILDIAKAEAGMLTLSSKPYSTDALFSEIRLMGEQKTREKGLELIFEISPRIPERLIGDSVRIKQMVLNLLTNAAKYTDRGLVKLGADMKQGNLIIAVSDTGIGIKPEDIAVIFKNFGRVPSNQEGTGLGLTITKQIVQAMGGTLTVESEYTKGSVFTLTFPQKTADGAVEQTRAAEGYFSCPWANILVVDDNRYNRLVAQKLLDRTGAKVFLADSGAGMLEECKKQRFDLILLDIMMKYMDGVEALKKLRETSGPNAHTPAAALTADAVVGARETYLSKGFVDYLAKPILPVELDAMLRRLLSRSSAAIDEAAGLGYSDNDPEFYHQLLGVFCEESEQTENALEKAFSDGNAAIYRTLVHALKNNARGIGANLCADICLEAEQAAAAGSLDEALHDKVTHSLHEAAQAAEELCAKQTLTNNCVVSRAD